MTDRRYRTESRWLLILLGLGLLMVARPAAAAGPFDTFVVFPCRALDTRFAVPPGPIAAGTSLNVVIVGDLTVGGTVNQGGESTCNVPPEAAGAFLNVVAVGAAGFGHLTAYPFGSALPLASTLNFATDQTIANGVLVPLCTPTPGPCPFQVTVTMGPSAAHVVIDVTGYVAP